MGGGRREKWGHIHTHFLSSLIYISLKIKKKNPTLIPREWKQHDHHLKPGHYEHSANRPEQKRKARSRITWRAGHGLLQSFVNWNHPGFWPSGCSTVPLVPLEPPGPWPCHCHPMSQPRAPRAATPNRWPGHSAVIHWGLGLGPPAQSSGLFHLGCELQAAKGRNQLLIMGSRVRVNLKFKCILN